MAQTATTGELAKAQNTVIDAARYTQEHNAPSWALIEKLTLPRGASTRRVPKVGQFTIADLVDGQDMVTEQEIGMTTIDLTATERGAKIIVTDKLVRQNGTTDIFRMLGRQFGDAAARKQDTDTQSLYSGLNSGVTFGAAGKSMTLNNFAGAIAKSRGGTGTANNLPFNPTYVVVHPHSAFDLVTSASVVGGNTAVNSNPPEDIQRSILRNFWKMRWGGVDAIESGNISINASTDDMIGVIAQMDALVGLTSVSWRTERERDASRRAWEVNFTSDYGVFELDDSKGAPMTFDATAPSDSA